MTVLIIITIIYILSVYGMWRWIRIAHSKGGIWYGLNAVGGDVMLMFLPLGNTIVLLLISPRKNDSNYNKFFKINK